MADDDHPPQDHPPQDHPPHDASNGSPAWKVIVFLVGAAVVGTVALVYRDAWSLESLAARETQLRALQSRHPVGIYAVAFFVYVAVTGLSLPGAAPLTLLYGWYFDFASALVVVSFASTAGATLAFLISRYLLRDAVHRRYADATRRFRQRLEEEGPFYLFTLRLIPAVPFFVINLAMGLTPISARRFWWVSQLGMLPGTMVYVYAGSRVPQLERLAQQGAGAVFSPWQLFQLTSAFVLLGVFPLVVRKLVPRLRRRLDGGSDGTPDASSAADASRGREPESGQRRKPD